jgi:hypothetical protein
LLLVNKNFYLRSLHSFLKAITGITYRYYRSILKITKVHFIFKGSTLQYAVPAGGPGDDSVNPPVQTSIPNPSRSTRTDVPSSTQSGPIGMRRQLPLDSRALSAPAKAMLDSFPLLNFMRSSVLVYPTRTVSRKK